MVSGEDIFAIHVFTTDDGIHRLSNIDDGFTLFHIIIPSFQVVGRSNITLTFQSASHTIKLPLGLTQNLDSHEPPSTDDLVGCL